MATHPSLPFLQGMTTFFLAPTPSFNGNRNPEIKEPTPFRKSGVENRHLWLVGLFKSKPGNLHRSSDFQELTSRVANIVGNQDNITRVQVRDGNCVVCNRNSGRAEGGQVGRQVSGVSAGLNVGSESRIHALPADVGGGVGIVISVSDSIDSIGNLLGRRQHLLVSSGHILGLQGGSSNCSELIGDVVRRSIGQIKFHLFLLFNRGTSLTTTHRIQDCNRNRGW